MRVIFYGGRQAGVVSLLTLMALKHEIVCVIPIDEPVETVAKSLKLNIQKPENINSEEFVTYLRGLQADLLICCHGRQIIKKELLSLCKSINVHPCLYKYPGADPIQRLLKDKNTRASVAVHWMEEEVDAGEVIVENFMEIQSDTVEGVYNELYPLYSKTIIKALEIIQEQPD